MRKLDRRSTPFDVDTWRSSLPSPSNSQGIEGEHGGHASSRAVGRELRHRHRNERAIGAERFPERASGNHPSPSSRGADASGLTSKPEIGNSDGTARPEAISKRNSKHQPDGRSVRRDAHLPDRLSRYREKRAGQHQQGTPAPPASPTTDTKHKKSTTPEQSSRRASDLSGPQTQAQKAQASQTRSKEHNGGVRLPLQATTGTRSVPSADEAETRSVAKAETRKTVSQRGVMGVGSRPTEAHDQNDKRHVSTKNDPVVYPPVLRLRPTASTNAEPDAKSADAATTAQVQTVQSAPKAKISSDEVGETSDRQASIAETSRDRYEFILPLVDAHPSFISASEKQKEGPVLRPDSNPPASQDRNAESFGVLEDTSESDSGEDKVLTPSATGSEVSIDFNAVEEDPVQQPTSSSAASQDGIERKPDAQRESAELDFNVSSVGASILSVEPGPTHVATEPEEKIVVPSPHTEEDWVVIDRQPGPPAALSPLARRLKAENEVFDAVRAKEVKKSAALAVGADLFAREEACGLEEEDWLLV